MRSLSSITRTVVRIFGSIGPAIALLAACLPFPAMAAGNIVSQTWHLRVGDDAQWASPAYPVSGWRDYNLGISSEHQCLGGETFWLRQTFLVPPQWTGAELRCALRLQAREAVLYLNGTRVPLEFKPDRSASFLVPTPLLRKPGEENHLALRIQGHDYTGGVGTDYLTIAPEKLPAPSVALTLGFGSADHVYHQRTDLRFVVNATTDAPESITGTLRIRIENEFHAPVCIQQRPAVITKDRAAFDYSLPELPPGFYQVVASFSAPGAEAQEIQWFAVTPTELHCPHSPPADLADYWKRAKAELAAVKPEYSVQLDEARSTARHLVYTASMKSVDGVTLRAWYIVPRKPGKYPAVLALPGYGGSFQPEWFMEDDDMIHLALDVRGHGCSAVEVHPGFGTPGFVGYNLLDPEHYAYRGAYLDAQRALDFLGTRPEVDATRLGVRGDSQGGGLSLATAALSDGRVKCCVAGVPFLGDLMHHLQIRTVYIPEFEEALKAAGHGTFADAVHTMSYVDTVNLAPWVRCPVLMGSGLFDDDCPPHIGFAAYNHLGGPKEYRIYPQSGHGIGKGWESEASAWLHRQLNTTQPAHEG